MIISLRPTPKQEENADFALALTRMYALRGGHVYEGTVRAKVKARRRAANRVAGRSRRVNQGQR